MNVEFSVKQYVKILVVNASQEDLSLLMSNIFRLLPYSTICEMKQVGNSYLVEFFLKEGESIKLLKDFLSKL